MRKMNRMRVGVVIFFALVLAACGRDVSTVDHALEGTWAMNDAFVNGEPLVDVMEENAEWFNLDGEEVARDEDGDVDYGIEFYYEEGVLTVVNSDGETTQTPYEVLAADDENGTMRLEYTLEEEDMTLVLEEAITFVGEERETRTSDINIVDVQMVTEASDADTELEQELEQFGQELVQELFLNMQFTFHFDYVSEEAPAEMQE